MAEEVIVEQVTPKRKFSITVEPVAFLYAFGLILHQPVINQFVYKAVGDMKGFQSDQIQKTGCDLRNSSLNNTVDNDELRREVQSLSSIVSLIISLSSSIPGLFVALLMGAMTDKLGRRPAIVMPPLGSAIEAAIVILVMYFKLPVYVLFAGALISGMCGSFSVIMIGILSYIADITEAKDRALRLAILEGMVFLGGCVSYTCSGIWIKYAGFIPPYWMVFSCEVAAFLYGVFFLKESRPKSVVTTAKPNCLHNLKQTFSVITQPRPEGSKYLIAMIVCTSLLTVCTMGISAVIILLALDSPFCMSSVLVGYLMAWRMFAISIGAIIGLKFLPRCGVAHPTVALFSILSLVASCLTLGLAENIPTLFLSAVVGILLGAASPILKGLMSKTVGPNQQGALFTGVVFAENVCNVLAAICFNSLYAWSQTSLHFHGFVFMIAASLGVICFIIFIYVRYMVKIVTSREMLEPPLVKNEITVYSEESSSPTTTTSGDYERIG